MTRLSSQSLRHLRSVNSAQEPTQMRRHSDRKCSYDLNRQSIRRQSLTFGRPGARMYPPHQPYQGTGKQPHHQMLQQKPLEPMALQLPLPRQQSCDDDRHRGQGCDQKVITRHDLECRLLHPMACEVESHGGQKQCNGKVHQHDVLGVLGEHDSPGIEWIDHSHYCTKTLPVILGWMEQKYSYVPGLVKV